jgi:hypothetical protein
MIMPELAIPCQYCPNNIAGWHDKDKEEYLCDTCEIEIATIQKIIKPCSHCGNVLTSDDENEFGCYYCYECNSTT